MKDPDPAFASKIPRACEFLDCATRSGIALVHCQGAVSRSPAVVLVFLCHQGRSLPEAVAYLSELVATKPNLVFLQAIAEHFAARLTASQLTELGKQLGRPATQP
jgi:protein-tyrosine phosphatase